MVPLLIDVAPAGRDSELLVIVALVVIVIGVVTVIAVATGIFVFIRVRRSRAATAAVREGWAAGSEGEPGSRRNSY
jgi:uncharacterized membrane protein YqiK